MWKLGNNDRGVLLYHNSYNEKALSIRWLPIFQMEFEATNEPWSSPGVSMFVRFRTKSFRVSISWVS